MVRVAEIVENIDMERTEKSFEKRFNDPFKTHMPWHAWKFKKEFDEREEMWTFDLPLQVEKILSAMYITKDVETDQHIKTEKLRLVFTKEKVRYR